MYRPEKEREISVYERRFLLSRADEAHLLPCAVLGAPEVVRDEAHTARLGFEAFEVKVVWCFEHHVGRSQTAVYNWPTFLSNRRLARRWRRKRCVYAGCSLATRGPRAIVCLGCVEADGLRGVRRDAWGSKTGS